MPGAREGYSRASRFGCGRIMASAFAAAAIVASLTLPALPQAASGAPKPVQPAADASHPHVYLMRGLLNIFSLGMDQLAADIQGHGITADVYNHTVADS